MANYSYTNSGIDFTVSFDKVKSISALCGNLSQTKWEDIDEEVRETGSSSIPVKPFVNAVEIDWNGAIIGES